MDPEKMKIWMEAMRGIHNKRQMKIESKTEQFIESSNNIPRNDLEEEDNDDVQNEGGSPDLKKEAGNEERE